MERRVDEQIAQTPLKQITDLTRTDQQNLDPRGEATVAAMGTREYLRLVAPAPDWLEKAWKGAEERGISNMTMDE